MSSLTANEVIKRLDVRYTKLRIFGDEKRVGQQLEMICCVRITIF